MDFRLLSSEHAVEKDALRNMPCLTSRSLHVCATVHGSSDPAAPLRSSIFPTSHTGENQPITATTLTWIYPPFKRATGHQMLCTFVLATFFCMLATPSTANYSIHNRLLLLPLYPASPSCFTYFTHFHPFFLASSHRTPARQTNDSIKSVPVYNIGLWKSDPFNSESLMRLTSEPTIGTPTT